MWDVRDFLAFILPAVHWTIVICIALRIVSKRREPGVALGWLILLVLVPLVGALAYLIFGEPWLSHSRLKRGKELRQPIENLMRKVEHRAGTELDDHPHEVGSIARLGMATGAMPIVDGNEVEILDGADETFPAVIRDIDDAKRTIELLFYIWEPAGRVLEVEAALARAAARGVKCRVLVDAAGGKPFFRSDSPDKLRAAGVQVAPALPVRWLRAQLSRIDLRNHRKLIVVDERIAYTGSLNMADPLYFKARAGVGQWVDAMCRVRGPAVTSISAVFEGDWFIETGLTRPEEVEHEPISGPKGEVEMQVVPSGPRHHQSTIHRMLIQGAHEARRELTLTTPYFTPDEAMLAALTSAAQRGVKVTVVVPLRVDSKLVALASSAYFGDLLDAGAEIRLFRGGLLHAKTVTIDDRISMLGTVNMDRRSFAINFELSVFFYDRLTCARLRDVQARYVVDSVSLEETGWHRRSRWRKLAENSVQLLAPLL